MRRQTVFVETWPWTSSAGFRDNGPEASVIPLRGVRALAPVSTHASSRWVSTSCIPCEPG